MRRCSRLVVAAWVATLVLNGCSSGSDEDSPATASGGDLRVRLDSVTVRPPSSQVSVSFAIADEEDRPVPNLQPGDFEILEDDVANSVFESSKRIALDARDFASYTLLLLDLSDSIVRSGSLPELVRSAKKLVARVFAEQTGDVQRMGLYWFDGGANIRNALPQGQFTADPQVILAALDSLPESEDRSTNLYGAVAQGLDLLQDTVTGEDGPAIRWGTLVLFTDGKDNAGRVQRGFALGQVNALVADSVSDPDRRLSSITIGLGGEIDRITLGDIGKTQTVFPGNIGALEEAFDDVADRIRDQANSFYLLEYCSPKRAGSHTLTIQAISSDRTGFATTDFDAEGFSSDCGIDGVRADLLAFGGDGRDFGRAIAADVRGRRVVTGVFTGTLDFDDTGLRPEYILESPSRTAAYLTKIQSADEGGGVLWTTRIGDDAGTVETRDACLLSEPGALRCSDGGSSGPRDLSSPEAAELVATGDLDETVVAGGFFRNRLRIGAVDVSSSGDTDGWVGAWSPDGAPLWTTVFDGTGKTVVESVAFGSFCVCGATIGDEPGHVDVDVCEDGIVPLVRRFLVVAGTFDGTLTAGGAEPIESAGAGDAFVARMSLDGEVLWLRGFGGDADDEGAAVAVGSEGGIWLAGTLRGEVVNPLAEEEPERPLLVSVPSTNDDERESGFVARYSRTGDRLFVRGLHPLDGGFVLGTSIVKGVATTPDGAAVVAGTYVGAAAVSGSGPEAGESRNRNGFAAKFSSTAQLVWARGFGGPGNDEVSDIASTPIGSTVIVGDFRGSARFVEPRLTAQDEGSDAFVLELSGSTGRHQSSLGFGGPGDDRALGVSADVRGDFHITGLFLEETFALGEMIMAVGTDGEADIFLLRVR